MFFLPFSIPFRTMIATPIAKKTRRTQLNSKDLYPWIEKNNKKRHPLDTLFTYSIVFYFFFLR